MTDKDRMNAAYRPHEIDYSIKKGDHVTDGRWVLSPLIVEDVNWALRAVALRLGEGGNVVVWSAEGLRKVKADDFSDCKPPSHRALKHQYRQGTDAAVAFNRGARWMQAALTSAPAEPQEADDQATWPEWAESILTYIRSQSGYDGYDDSGEGIDLPAEVKEHVSELNNIIDRLTNWPTICAISPRNGRMPND